MRWIPLPPPWIVIAAYVLNEAVAAYLEVQQWHLADIRKAVVEAEAGDFATGREVERAFAKYKRDAR